MVVKRLPITIPEVDVGLQMSTPQMQEITLVPQQRLKVHLLLVDVIATLELLDLTTRAVPVHLHVRQEITVTALLPHASPLPLRRHPVVVSPVADVLPVVVVMEEVIVVAAEAAEAVVDANPRSFLEYPIVLKKFEVPTLL